MIEVTRYEDRSLSMTIFQNVVKLVIPVRNWLFPAKFLPAGSPPLIPPSSAKERCNIRERFVHDTWLYDHVPEDMQIKDRNASGTNGTGSRSIRVY